MDIRDVTENDKAAWHGLWGGFLAFYNVTLDRAIDKDIGAVEIGSDLHTVLA